MNSTELKALKTLLSQPKQIAIVTHWSPDGDAMGSSLGLYNYLIQKKHAVTVITPNDYPSFLNWLPGDKKVINHQLHTKKADRILEKADLIFCLDFNSLKRINSMGETVEKSRAVKVMIDHHLEPDDFAEYVFHSIASCSTCELVAEFMEAMGDRKLLNKEIADCLYTGIMTDTGSFRFPSTTAKTHRIVADLIGAGAENAEIHNRIYDDSTENKLRLLGYCLSEKLTVLPDYSTAFFSLSQDDLNRFNYQKGDTEGVVNYALSIRGIRFAAFLVERDGLIKMSFRSKGNFDVNQFARKHFDGGGHKNASGGATSDTLDDTVSKFVSLLGTYKNQLKRK